MNIDIGLAIHCIQEEENMLCRICGTEVPDGTSFCPRCGNSISENNMNDNSYSQNEYGNMSYPGQGGNVNLNQTSGGYYGNQQSDADYYGNQQPGTGYYGNQQSDADYYGNQQPDTGYYGNQQPGGAYYGNQQSGGAYYGNQQSGTEYYGNQQSGEQYYGNNTFAGQYPDNSQAGNVGNQYYANQHNKVKNKKKAIKNSSNKKGPKPKKKRSLKASILLSIFMLLIIAGVTVAIMFFMDRSKGRSSEEVVNQFIEALNKNDTKKLLSLMNKETVDYLKKSLGYKTDKEVSGLMNDFIDAFKDDFAFIGDDEVTFSSKIISQNSDIGYSIKELNKMYKEEYGKNIHIKAAKEVMADVSYKSKEDGTGETQTFCFTMIKIKNVWYLLTVDVEGEITSDDDEKVDKEAAKKTDKNNIDEIVSTVKNCITDAGMEEIDVVELAGEPACYYIKDNGVIIFASFNGVDDFVPILEEAFKGYNTSSKEDPNKDMIRIDITLNDEGVYEVTAEYVSD